MAPEPASPILRPRFKGIENFLRRIAFNLGNSPSQTEVKIISCIPIDVTDLQNKIVDLERELDERGHGNSSSEEDDTRRRSKQARAAIGAPTYTPAPLFSNNTIDAPADSLSLSLNAEPPSRVSLSEVDSSPTGIPKSSTTTLNDRQELLVPSSVEGYEDTKKKQKTITKIKKSDKNKKGKTQMVYFTETIYPKKMCEEAIRQNKRRGVNEEKLSQTYLTDMMQRQYRPKLATQEPSSSSGFSWPVCRDEPASVEADVCSCCHGLFHNVDTACHADYSVYYDSSLYDVVPVKERPSRIMKDDPVYQKRQNDVFLNMEDDYFPSKPNKPLVQFQQPYVTRYCAVASPYRTNPKHRYKKKFQNKSALKREQVIRAMQKRKQDHHSAANMSYSGYVECGNVYAKQFHRTPRLVLSPPPPPPPPPPSPPSPPSPPPTLKNAECLTINLNEKEHYTSTSRSVQLDPPLPPPPLPPPPLPPAPPHEDNKTEITLNQIKSILHAVLTEIKTTAQVKNALEDKPTKDAIVQNGLSHSNIAANSSYMNSYLYSPRYSFGQYDSGQTAGNQSFYQPGSMVPPPGLFGPEMQTPSHGMPFSTPGPSPCAEAAKCVQNYPVFIQTTGQKCACCYRSVPAQPKLPSNVMPAHNSTNTKAEKNEQRSNETKNLVKEIYKSLALDMNYPHKDTFSNYSDRSSANASNNKIELKFVPKRKPKTVTSETLPKGEKPPLFVSKGLGEHFGSTAVSFRSEMKTATTAASSGKGTESATPRGDGVRSLLSTKKELLSTGSDTAQEARQPTARNRRYSPPAGRSREYSPPTGRTREYSASTTRERGYPDTRNRGYSPPNNRDREYSPPKNRGREYTVPALTTSVSDEDTATLSNEESEQSESTVVGTEKKEKKGIFSKMKKLFTTRPRRRRKKNDDTSSEKEEEPTSDSDDYETVYSEISTRSERRTKHRPPTPPPAPRRRRPHSKVSFSRYHNRRDPPTPRSPRYRRESPVMAPPRARRSPYMEQEYRRHWTEDLMFHRNDAPRFSSDRPFTRSGRETSYGQRTSPPTRSAYSPFWREYEAHYALVPPYAPPHAPQPPFPPPNYLPPLQPPLATPRYSPRYQPIQNQVDKLGQIEPAKKPTYLPRTYKAAPRGFSWLKKLNTNCGVPWKHFFLEA